MKEKICPVCKKLYILKCDLKTGWLAYYHKRSPGIFGNKEYKSDDACYNKKKITK